MLLQPLACNCEAAGCPLGGLQQRLVKALLPCLGDSDTRTWNRSLRQQRVAPTAARALGPGKRSLTSGLGPLVA